MGGCSIEGGGSGKGVGCGDDGCFGVGGEEFDDGEVDF